MPEPTCLNLAVLERVSFVIESSIASLSAFLGLRYARTARLRPGPLLIAPRTTLGRPELVHLGHPLLELDVLTFLVAVPLLLCLYVSICPSIHGRGVAVSSSPVWAPATGAVGCGPTSHFQGR